MRASSALAFKISIGVFIAILILGYGLFQARNIILGPEITLLTPQNGQNLFDPLVTISGSAMNISHISLNDRQIFVDKKGNFSEKLLVPSGYTIIKLAAQDRFGRTTQKLIELNYAGSSTVAMPTIVDTLEGTSSASTIATSTQTIIQ